MKYTNFNLIFSLALTFCILAWQGCSDNIPPQDPQTEVDDKDKNDENKEENDDSGWGDVNLTPGQPQNPDDDDSNTNNDGIDPSKCTRNPIDLSPAEQQVGIATNAFAWNLMGQSFAHNEKNTILSPLSVSMLMSMIATCTTDYDAINEIYNILGYTNMDVTAVNNYNNKIAYGILNADTSVKTAIANSVWASPDYTYNKACVDELAETYNAEFFTINYPTFAHDVNNWCARKTNNMITNFLDESTKYTYPLFFANALYFKGFWDTLSTFSTAKTTQEYFTDIRGNKQMHDMMHKTKTYQYAKTSTMSMVSIHFGLDVFSFDIILPNKGVGIDACLSALAEGQWQYMQNNTTVRNVILTLPKFEINSRHNIKSTLKAMGANKTFTSIDICNRLLMDSDAFIDKVEQVARLKIDEKGAEAAAVTGAAMGASSGPDEKEYETITFCCDRPFIYAIREGSSGAILFVGVVSGF